jgi:hypothetical protein
VAVGRAVVAPRAVERLALGVAAGLAVLGVASSTDAQQWTIYLFGHTEPVRATFYTEETPWIFYRDDDSQYVFAVGCDRVRRVTRDGIEIALFCPVERLPTMMPRVYQGILDREAKNLEDANTRYRDRLRACNQAAGAPVGASGGEPARQAEAAPCQSPEAIAFREDPVRDAEEEVRQARRRLGALLELVDMYKTDRPGPVQRFFFFFKR